MAAITQPNNSYGKSPMRMLSKGSDLYSNPKLATPLTTRSNNNRRKTAAERLEADKFKYVKSEEVRQRRFTLELRTSSPPNNNDSSGSHSMGTASTGSPSNVEEDDGMEDILTEDIITSMTGVISYKEPKQREPIVSSRPVPTRDMATATMSASEDKAELSHSITANRRRQRIKNHAQRTEEAKAQSPTSPLIARLRERLANTSTNNTSPSPTLSISTNSAKQSSADSPMSESASSQLGLSDTKTPDSFLSNKNVMFAPYVERNTRKPRSTTTSDNFQSRRYRSASAGANVNRKIREMNAILNEHDKQIDPIMSPKTQLKLARDKLKKVPSSSSDKTSSRYNKLTSYQKFKESSTFTVVPNRSQSASEEKEQNLTTKPPIPKGKPIKDSIPSQERKNNEKKLSEVSKQSSTVTVRTNNNRSSTNANHRQSWDPLQANNIHVSASKSPTEDGSLQRTKSSDKSVASSISAPRQRKSWSKPPSVPSSSETKRNNRMSLPEDSMQPFRGSSGNSNAIWISKSGTRKSFAEALEDILNPVYESEQGTVTPTIERINTASPDAVSLTVVGNESVSSSGKVRTRNSSVADNINSALCGTIDEDWSRQSNYSEMETQETSDKHHDCNKQQHNIKLKHRKSADNLIEDVWIKHYNDGLQNESNKSKPSAASRLRSKSSQPYHHRQNSAPANVTQNHRDRRRQVGKSWDETKENYNYQPQESPILAPRSRKEVLPDYAQKAGPTIEKMKSPMNENTLKSQNTTSSASADANKPFTALTANDLKPRKNSQNVQSPSTPVKAMFAYPSNPAPTPRQNPKRHTGPVSPTLSPHKQIPRLTPPQTPSRSSSSTPYSSLKRTPTSSRNSSLKRNHRHRRSDSGPQQSELDRFFSTMGMDESILYNGSSIFSGNHVSSESDFSFAGASAYVRDSSDEMMDLDPIKPFSKQPQTVSIIEKNARVMRWLMACRANNKKSLSTGSSPRHSTNTKPLIATQPIQSSSKHSFESGDSPPVFQSCEDEDNARPNIPPRHKRDVNLHYQQAFKNSAPPIPPRTYMRHPDVAPISIPKESDV